MTERIRWEDEPAGYAVTEDGFIGPAELNWRAFRIWRPDARVDPRPFLTSDLHGQARRQVHGTLDELKAAAERWLEEFVSSLGAIFPPEPDESAAFQLSEARDMLARWDAGQGGEPVHSREKVLADQLRAVLAIVGPELPEYARCEEPITGTPVTDPDDLMRREFCGEDCRDGAAEASYEQRYQPGVAT